MAQLNVGNMTYYRLYPHYKKSFYFFYSQENKFSGYDLISGILPEKITPFIYEAEEIHPYIYQYDLLPCASGPMLVSKKFKGVFEHLDEFDADFLPATIVCPKQDSIDDFYVLHIKAHHKGLDKERSVFEPLGKTLSIKVLYLIPNFMEGNLITRLEENRQRIIVDERFKKLSEQHKLKGLGFMEEGDSIYV